MRSREEMLNVCARDEAPLFHDMRGSVNKVSVAGVSPRLVPPQWGSHADNVARWHVVESVRAPWRVKESRALVMRNTIGVSLI
ncbi:uncharacterized protein G2W53_041810 [Senna tora]|uniref:Uncharacterized protein n=1 Tax=Senna tora TaxID=362788 RepID=A0A834W382_9FABA|nr:uncharacterized protein G2W53_041810 [Senna tora]